MRLYYWLRHKWFTIQKKYLPSFDFKYAFRELFLIVAGILIALTINNWNDGRKQKANEIKMLKEIKTSLNNDLSDIQGNLQILTPMQLNKQILIDSEKTGYHDSLHQHLNSLIYDRVYLAINRGSFESLKSVGLYLISNDSIRLKIVNLYEYTYKIQEKNEQEKDNHYLIKANEFSYQVMKLHEEQQGQRERYKRLFEETEFKVFLYQVYNFDRFKQNQYLFFERTLQALIAEIEAEIKRLERGVGLF